jgi:hypothetical protein
VKDKQAPTMPNSRKRKGEGLVEMNSISDVESYINNGDEEIGMLLAMRGALRTFPYLISALEEGKDEIGINLILRCFKTISFTWLICSKHKLNPSLSTSQRMNYRVYTLSRNFLGNAYSVANAIGLSANVYFDILDSKEIYKEVKKTAIRALHIASSAISQEDEAQEKLFWTQVASDASSISIFNNLIDINVCPLWEGLTAIDFSTNWALLKNRLLSLNDNWQVWTNWYEDRLVGGSNPNGRPVIEELELKRVLIADEDWKKGPSHVNAMIAALEEEYRPPVPSLEVPDQRPAIIEVELGEDGKLHRRPEPSPQARDQAQEDRLREAWQSLQDDFEDLKSLNVGRNEPAFLNVMKRYSAALGATYDDLKVIALGVQGARFGIHAQDAGERYLEGAASEVKAFSASHALFIKQFHAWRDYLKDASDEPSPEMVEALRELAYDFAEAEDLFDEEAGQAYKDLADDVGLGAPDGEDRILLSRPLELELLRSVENGLSALLNPFVVAARATGKAFAKGALKGVEKGAEKGVEKLIKNSIPALGLAASSQVMVLAGLMPAEFGWVLPVLKLLMPDIKITIKKK